MTIEVAFVGLSHDHIWGELGYWIDHPAVEITAACDENQALLDRFAQTTGVQTTYPTLEALLAAQEPNVIHISASNRQSALIAEMVLSHGINVVLEKPLSASIEEAESLIDAWRRSPAKLVVNWRDWWTPSYQLAHQMVQNGAIGEVFATSCRMAHPGPKRLGCSKHFCDWLLDPVANGGGVMVDYGCYGALLATEFLGMPRLVGARALVLRPVEHPVDDNAVITMEHERGLSIAEGSWTTTPPSRDARINGTDGTIWLNDKHLAIQTAESERIEFRPTEEDVPYSNVAQYLVKVLEEGLEVEGPWSPMRAFEVQLVLEAAKRSLREGRQVPPDLG